MIRIIHFSQKSSLTSITLSHASMACSVQQEGKKFCCRQGKNVIGQPLKILSLVDDKTSRTTPNDITEDHHKPMRVEQ